MPRTFLVKPPLLPTSLERAQSPAISSMRIAIFLALLAVAWADSLIKKSPSTTLLGQENKEKEKRETTKTTSTPGIRYAPTNQQQQPQQPQAQNYVTPYATPQQLLQHYSTLPQEYVQRGYHPQASISRYMTPPPQQRGYAPLHQQTSYQFTPKSQASTPVSVHHNLAQHDALDQQHVLAQQQFLLAQSQAFSYPPLHQSPQLLLSNGHHGGYNFLLPSHQQQGLGYGMQPIILLAIQPQYDTAVAQHPLHPLLNYQPTRGLQYLTGEYQQPYFTYPQQQQIAYILPHMPTAAYNQPVLQETVSTTTPSTVPETVNFGQKSVSTTRQKTPQYKP